MKFFSACWRKRGSIIDEALFGAQGIRAFIALHL
jgi:hypothetical protein